MTMRKILLLGAGQIGPTIAELLLRSGQYHLRVGDRDSSTLRALPQSRSLETVAVDCSDSDTLLKVMEGCQVVVSALPFQRNLDVATAALQSGASYFDLTEDVEATAEIRELSTRAQDGQVFVPQCGLAPGFIGIVTYHLCEWFDEIETVKMRVGALPRFASNEMLYNLTWSTDGLINEYCRECDAVHNGRRVKLLPLEGVEHLLIDGDRYEAFNTSGGLGTLCETLDGKVQELNYKTIRYVGHRDLIAFLLEGLRIGEDDRPRQRQEILREVLERSIPTTFQDVVVTFCTVIGSKAGKLVQISDVRKIFGQGIERDYKPQSAIQLTTAAGLCGVLDLHLSGRLKIKQGFVRQEDVDFDDFMSTDFGRHYAGETAPRSFHSAGIVPASSGDLR